MWLGSWLVCQCCISALLTDDFFGEPLLFLLSVTTTSASCGTRGNCSAWPAWIMVPPLSLWRSSHQVRQGLLHLNCSRVCRELETSASGVLCIASVQTSPADACNL